MDQEEKRDPKKAEPDNQGESAEAGQHREIDSEIGDRVNPAADKGQTDPKEVR